MSEERSSKSVSSLLTGKKALEGAFDYECITDAESYVRSLVGQGIINGYEDGTLKPNASMMRGEVAKVLTVLR